MSVIIELKDIDNLAPMPVSVVQLATLAVDPKANMADIAEVIEFDEALTANILHLVNSVWGKALTPILTVKDAVVRLGTGQILKIAVGQHISGPMSESCKGYKLEEHELWRHSVCSALAAEQLSAYLFNPIPRLAFTAALMHDIGKVLMSRHISFEVLQDIRELIRHEGISFAEAEKQILGTNHSEVGGDIAERWKFPPQLVTAIKNHHDPESQPEALLDVVYMANAVTKHLGTGLGVEEMHLKSCPQVPKRLGISPEDLEQLCANVYAELLEKEKRFNINQTVAS